MSNLYSGVSPISLSALLIATKHSFSAFAGSVMIDGCSASRVDISNIAKFDTYSYEQGMHTYNAVGHTYAVCECM
jgi:hypothetical protein